MTSHSAATTDLEVKHVRIEDIKVGKRARVDLGDLSDLMQSIKEHGLLHAIVITTEGELVAGERRLAACRKLGWQEIPVRVAERITDAIGLLTAERDENTCRKGMTGSELVVLGRALERLKRPEAAARQRATQAKPGERVGGLPGNTALKPDTVAEIEAGKTDIIVSKALGIGSTSYWRAKALVQAAEAGDERATEAVEQMDRTGKITPAYNAWRDRASAPSGHKPKAAAPVAAAPRTTSNGRRLPQRSLRKQLGDGITALSGLCTAFAAIGELDDSVDAEEAALWTRDLSEVLRVLRSLNNKLKEHSNGSQEA